MPVDRQAFVVLPAPHRANAAIEIRGDFLPGIEAIAVDGRHPRILVRRRGDAGQRGPCAVWPPLWSWRTRGTGRTFACEPNHPMFKEILMVASRRLRWLPLALVLVPACARGPFDASAE